MSAPAPVRDFALKVVIVVAIAAGLAAAWMLREVLLLLFGAILVSIILHAGARLVLRLRPMPYGLALAIATFLIAVILAGFLSFFGLALEAQAADLMSELPVAWTRFQQTLGTLPGGKAIQRALAGITGAPNLQWLGKLPAFAAVLANSVGDLVLVLVAAVYLAAQPRLYIDGALRLLPEAGRGAARRVVDMCWALLRRWLFAQLVAMVSVGLLFGVGLWVLGVPAAGALGVFAGLAEFVPLAGPILAAIPALIFASSGGVYVIAGTLALYLCIHAFESNLLQPLLQRGMTSVPPVVMLFSLVVFFAFFGMLGLVFAAPLTIVAMVAVQDLYLNEHPRPPWAPLSIIRDPDSSRPGD